MTELEREIFEGLDAIAEKALREGGRERVACVLSNWLAFTTRKKPSADLPQKVESFRKRIQAMSSSLALKCSHRGYVVRASGDGQETLRLLERGTDWFAPMDNMTETILGAIFENV